MNFIEAFFHPNVAEMDIVKQVNIYLLVFLGAITGLLQVFGFQAEYEILGVIGFSYELLVLIGLIRLLGAVLIVIPETQRLGGMILLTTCAFGAIVLFMNSSWLMGVTNVLLCIMTLYVIVASPFNEKPVLSHRKTYT